MAWGLQPNCTVLDEWLGSECLTLLLNNTSDSLLTQMLTVKSGKEYRVEIDDAVSAVIPADICHLFDVKTGERL